MSGNRCAYYLRDDSSATLHRVHVGDRLISALATHSDTPTCTIIDRCDAELLGVDLAVSPRSGQCQIEAIRPGLGSSDDELVGKLTSWDDGRADWIVPLLPTPRGMSIASLMLSFHETRTDPSEVLKPQVTHHVGVRHTDDRGLLTSEFSLDADQSKAHHLRSWTAGSFTLIAGEPDEDDIAHLCTVVDLDQHSLGELLLSRDEDPPRYFHWRFSPLQQAVPWISLSAELRRIAEAAKASLWV